MVAGGGVLGLSVAAKAAAQGARIRLYEPSDVRLSASGVAAGMLSPALECLLEEREAAYPLFRAAYDAWPAFLAELGLPAAADFRAGAVYLGGEEELTRLASGLKRLGEPFAILGRSELQQLQPGLKSLSDVALKIGREGRIDPLALLPAMMGRLRAMGVEIVGAACTPQIMQAADAAVIASGYAARAFSSMAPELEALRPIKGHVLHFEGGARDGPTVRTARGYAAPHVRGTVFGATMEPGHADLDVDHAAVSALRSSAIELFPELADAPHAARVGVRAAVEDGLPLVGRSMAGPILATAARRNGWLLAPLIAEAAVEALVGAPARPEFDPLRLWSGGEIPS